MKDTRQKLKTHHTFNCKGKKKTESLFLAFLVFDKYKILLCRYSRFLLAGLSYASECLVSSYSSSKESQAYPESIGHRIDPLQGVVESRSLRGSG
jgi:hypothetical protein